LKDGKNTRSRNKYRIVNEVVVYITHTLPKEQRSNQRKDFLLLRTSKGFWHRICKQNPRRILGFWTWGRALPLRMVVRDLLFEPLQLFLPCNCRDSDCYRIWFCKAQYKDLYSIFEYIAQNLIALVNSWAFSKINYTGKLSRNPIFRKLIPIKFLYKK